MTTTETPDTIDLAELVGSLFSLAGIHLTEETEDTDGEPDTDENVDPFDEAARILEDLEEYATDRGDTDLLLAIADRYIAIGDMLNN